MLSRVSEQPSSQDVSEVETRQVSSGSLPISECPAGPACASLAAMAGMDRGLYEALITQALEAQLQQLGVGLVAQRSDVRAADIADRIALHLGRLIRRAVESVPERQRVATAIELATALIGRMTDVLGNVIGPSEAPVTSAEILQAVVSRLPDGAPQQIDVPLIPLLDTTLLTNAPGEPRVGRQVITEINSADQIDLVMAFIRVSGIRPMLDALRQHREAGRPLRVLTTSYTGSTEKSALDMLTAAGADVRVSYDKSSTRLHAKAWLFRRHSGYSTAYIGSSNLTYSAQVTGLEWNVRLSAVRNPDVIEKVSAVFESYWNSGDFVRYDPAGFTAQADSGATRRDLPLPFSPIEVRLEAFQERLLEQIELSRQLGHHRNLLASATGTGKTVMAAVDYARLKARMPRARLLFVAHRDQILTQSHSTFRHVLRDWAFGELWVGGSRPSQFNHVFASIQSLSASGLRHLAPDHFDVVIIDEFHHAAARTYSALIDHVRPVELLALTATPERSDGLPVLHWFNNRIAAELRLWDAIDQHRLSPFVYFGIHDGLDLREIPWVRGRGYDATGLSNLLTANDIWARAVLAQANRHVDDVRRMRALGFCVSVEHARFMARVFCDAGIPAAAVWADTPGDERGSVLAKLAAGELNAVFSVDLFNEGVDVPLVDTLLLLRPTDSPTLFIQQLGRGLRRHPAKSVCTVLDFVGLHRKEFRFDRRFGALLGGGRKALMQQVKDGFPFLPAGCHMELDAVASDIVLRSLREAIPSGWSARVAELRRLARGRNSFSLAEFLDESGLTLEDIYQGGRCWSDTRVAAGLEVHTPGRHEVALRKALGRLLHIDDLERLGSFRKLVSMTTPPDLGSLTERERRLVRMLIGSLWSGRLPRDSSLLEGVELISGHPQVRGELGELFDALATRIDHVHQSLPSHPSMPLQIHARYSRLEILAASGIGSAARIPTWQTGVQWIKGERADLLAFTLDKTSGQFSPTTRYRDYAISRELIHWESQSVTRADSSTGIRYRRHEQMGTSVLLFARLRADDRAFWFLGPASYVSHQSEQPMAITWRLHHPLPGDLYARFAAAVA